ncbi:MAG: carbon-nitrogen hydrolase family protein [Candidatus Poribacteria bacterium]|nr:carbon-nitrogen hydrolase family protein [Candidatus Poribacteria bacterium]
MKIRVAGAQLPITEDIGSNLAAIRRAIDYAASENADILLTPEGSLSGYTYKFDKTKASAALTEVRELAKVAGIGLALGTCFVEPEDEKCYNQIRFYQPDGDYLGFHSKTLTCGSLTDPPKGEINHYAISPLRTFDYRGIPVAGLICNDLWANPECTPIPDPHLTHKLYKMGARIIFHAINGGRDGSERSVIAWQYHESNLRMRARASGLWIIPVDNCHPTHIPCSCPSGVINPSGDWAVKVDPLGEQYFAHTIQLDA